MHSKLKKGLTIGTIVFAVVLAIVVAVLLIVGITGHDEATFMEVCRHGDRVLYFDQGIEGERSDGEVACERTTEPLWTKASFPLTVTALSHDGKVLQRDHDAWRAIDQALEDANSQFGFQAFQKVAPGSPATVTIFWGVPYGNGPAERAEGYVSHFYNRDGSTDLVSGNEACDSNGLCAHVGIRAIASERVSYIVLVHELGHVLFLGHDDYTASVMYPLSFDDSEDATIVNWTRFVDGDVDAIQERFSN